MLERFRRRTADAVHPGDTAGGGVGTAERGEHDRHEEPTTAQPARGDGDTGERHGGAGGAAAGATAGAASRDHALRARDEYGGINWGAAFFGWLVAVGLTSILVAIIAAAGAAIGLTDDVTSGTVGIVGGALFLLATVIAYFAGGYVAGRMSRFDGVRQGIGAWIVGLIITILVAAAGAIFGAEANIFQNLNLPRIPVDEGDLTTGGIIALLAILIGTLIAAALGGKAGRNYHKKVDRAAGLRG